VAIHRLDARQTAADHTAHVPPKTGDAPALRRELGRWDLTAIGVNQVIGGAVFLMPALVAANVGRWSWILVGLVGVASMTIALSFAEAGSRFDGTGGPYLYARAAFGRFVGFEVGWMLWFTRTASWASVVNGLMDALAFYWPTLQAGAARPTLITALTLAIAGLNIRGIRQSAWVIDALTIGKVLPLLFFCFVGLWFISPSRLVPDGEIVPGGVAAAAIYLVFTFGGYEVVPVPGGETRDPRRDIPFALIMTIALVTLIFTLAQIVALGTLPDLSASKTPLADSALLFAGATGALLMTAGAAISMTGNNVGQAVAGSRHLFALAEQRDIPGVLARIHRVYRTPWTSILATSVIALALALTGSFATLAAGSAVSRLVVYLGTCAAVLAFRRASFTGRVPPALFTIPGGPVIPMTGILVAIAILAGATRQGHPGIRIGAIALVGGAVLYLLAADKRR
jgi:basic amino acid/polyamine antiporter, APA family